MTGSTKKKHMDYWERLEIKPNDLQYLSGHLFETEEPLSIGDLTKVLIEYRLDQLKKAETERQEDAGTIYLPKETFSPGDKIAFPELDDLSGVVLDLREGNNPSLGNFKVAKVELEDGSIKEFATDLENHAINQKNYQSTTLSELDSATLLKLYGKQFKSKLRKALDEQNDLIRIGETWFPRSLLIDLSPGHLNIAEAILDSLSGGPISIQDLMVQLELADTDENRKLLEFSLNYALQEDPRFDEVGTTRQFSWFLRRLEPDTVLETPLYIRSDGPAYLDPDLDETTFKLLSELDDELSFSPEEINAAEPTDKISVTLTYPHWRAGSLPVTPLTNQVLPSALESQNIRIEFIDQQTQNSFSAWVVRNHNYVIGLRDWYLEKNLIPGSIIEISTTDDIGNMLIKPQKKRSNKEWIKTVLVGADGGLVFALLRQPISAGFNERMAIAIPDGAGLDEVWKTRQSKTHNLKTEIMRMMSELSKLNNQRHVHFVDLYAALNVIRRTAPMDLLNVLTSSEEFFHVGDNYYHITEKS